MVRARNVRISPGLLLEGRYRLGERIAAGGMGEVWRATDLVLGRPVAVKLLRSGHAEQEEYQARFRAEARHAGLLSHPGIATVYDYREADPPYPPYLVMELVDGPSLARLLDEGPVDPARTMGLIAQAARALQAAHAVGLVHRDIKPGNLLVSQSGHVKITDFGIAQAAGSVTLTRPGLLIGTPAYLAPERAAGASATPAADLYALGIVAFQCLTGRLPFAGEPLAVALAHLEQPLPPLPPSVPADVAALVADLTAKDPVARPASAGEVAERAAHLRTALTATAIRQRGKQEQRVLAGRPLQTLALSGIAAIAAVGWLMSGMHGWTSAHPQSSPPAATRQPSPRVSHQGHHVVPARETGNASATEAPVQGHQPRASRQSPPPTAAGTGSPAPSRTPDPSGSPAPGRTPDPSGSPAPGRTPEPSGSPVSSRTPEPSGSPVSSQTPDPSGSPAPSDTSTAMPGTGPASS